MLLPLLLLLAAPVLQDNSAADVCQSEVRWLPTETRTVNRSTEQHPFSVFTSIGGSSGCAAASLRLTVVYFDSNGGVLCSGALDDVAPLRSHTQITSLLINVSNHFELVRWRNGPRELAVRPLPLSCLNADATAETQPAELSRAASMRIFATVVSPHGAAGSAQLELTLRN